uniref:Uncharacterized protein n=1 Tax=Guillardia theta TaxID=55529 RepID=A0A6U5W5B1_GUITH
MFLCYSTSSPRLGPFPLNSALSLLSTFTFFPPRPLLLLTLPSRLRFPSPPPHPLFLPLFLPLLFPSLLSLPLPLPMCFIDEFSYQIRKRSSRDKGSAPSAPLAQSEEEEEDLSELIKQRDEWKEKVDEQRRIAEKLEAEIEELEASLAT